MKKLRVHVTDHAVLRYLERVYGVNIEGLRKRIKKQVETNVPDDLPAPSGVHQNRVRFKIAGGNVVTVLSNRKHRRTRSSK